MAKLSMCRICLANEIGMQSITNTHLQEMFESLTFMPFETKDNRPQEVCYICCAKLENCYQLRKLCLRSEELLTQMLNSDGLEPADLKENLHMNRLRVTAAVHLSMGYVEGKHTDCDVNLGVSELFKDIEVKVEAVEDVPVIPTQTIQTNPGDITFSNSQEHESAEDKVEEIEHNDNMEIVSDKTEKVYGDKITNKQTVFNLNKETKSTVEPVVDKHKLFSCDICQKCYAYKSQLLIHSHLHTGNKPYQCNVCSKSYSQKSILKRHALSHTGEKRYQCDVCKKCFSEKVNLHLHVLAHAGVKPIFQCDLCGKGLSEKRSLINHIRLHMNQKKFQCRVCQKCFTTKRILSRHFYTHTREENKCEVCKKCFSSKGSLSRHLRKHNSERPYQCNVCSKSYSHKSNLKRHVLSHTGQKRYPCDICEKCFSEKFNLQKHILAHAGVKPLFQCDVCGKYLSGKRSLINHIRLHTNDKTFQCHVCKKCFTTERSLSCHFYTHTRVENKCEVCKKCFTRKATLSRHLRKHNSEKP